MEASLIKTVSICCRARSVYVESEEWDGDGYYVCDFCGRACEVSHLREPDRTVSVGLDVYGMADAITR